MRIHELEHLIRAAGAVCGCDEIVIIGSQAILASFPDAPAELLVSQEADLYPLENPSLADLIDGSIGELSPFHDQFGYFAHGIGPQTAALAPGWQRRLVKIRNENTRGITGLCLAPVDIAISKLLAGREKDIEFVSAMLRFRLVEKENITRLAGELTQHQSETLTARLSRLTRP